MRIDLDDALFDVHRRPLDLLGLIALCHRMGHVVGSREAVVRAWVDALSVPVGGAVERLLTEHRALLAGLRPTMTLTVTAQPSDWVAARVSVDDAWRFLRAPLELLLENERGDWHFLRRLATATQRRELDEALARGALAIRQGGGISEVTKSVEALFAEPTEPATRVRRLRTWVLFDRDADKADNQQPDAAARVAHTSCSKAEPTDPWNLRFHRLERRHIESYLPDRLLRTWSARERLNLQAAAAALARLRADDPAAADAVHMKKGLRMAFDDEVRRGLANADSPTQAKRRADEAMLTDWPPPWDRVPSEVRADLLAGFGGTVADLYRTASPGYDADCRTEFGLRESVSARRLVESILERL